MCPVVDVITTSHTCLQKYELIQQYIRNKGFCEIQNIMMNTLVRNVLLAAIIAVYLDKTAGNGELIALLGITVMFTICYIIFSRCGSNVRDSFYVISIGLHRFVFTT